MGWLGGLWFCGVEGYQWQVELSCSCLLPREFARWKVRNTAIERRDLVRHPVPLMPEFQRSIRLLGRRPTTQQFIETIIKKYGTHLLISATLGGTLALTGPSPCHGVRPGLEKWVGWMPEDQTNLDIFAIVYHWEAYIARSSE